MVIQCALVIQNIVCFCLLLIFCYCTVLQLAVGFACFVLLYVMMCLWTSPSLNDSIYHEHLNFSLLTKMRRNNTHPKVGRRSLLLVEGIQIKLSFNLLGWESKPSISEKENQYW
jgi:hypothetical protein